MTEEWVHTRITEHDKAQCLVGSKSPPEKKLWNAPSAGVIVVKRKKIEKNPQNKSRASLLDVRRCQQSVPTFAALALRDRGRPPPRPGRDPSISEVCTPEKS